MNYERPNIRREFSHSSTTHLGDMAYDFRANRAALLSEQMDIAPLKISIEMQYNILNTPIL
jgi:hypothetical protein